MSCSWENHGRSRQACLAVSGHHHFRATSRLQIVAPSTSSVLASTRKPVSWGECKMIWIANILVALVAALHVYFLILEMFLWTKPLGLKTFHQSLDKANDSAVLAANQG